MRIKYGTPIFIALGMLAAISYFVITAEQGGIDSDITGKIPSSPAPAESRSLDNNREPPILQGSFEDAKRNIDPIVFQPLGPKAYQIVRLDDARPPGDALKYIQSLISKSKSGDTVATFSIYLAIADCRNYLSGVTDRPNTIETSANVDLKDLEKTERKISECESLPSANSIMEENWLELAAKQGSVEAKLYYSLDSKSIIGDPTDRIRDPEKLIAWKEQSVAYLKEVAGTGNIDAIARLSNAYENGIMVDRNPELAYAYALAANMIKPDSSGPVLIRSLENSLSIKQQESGALLSHNIYKSCCTP